MLAAENRRMRLMAQNDSEVGTPVFDCDVAIRVSEPLRA
jgi:hypothetical protein